MMFYLPVMPAIIALKKLVREENLSEDKTERLIENYIFSEPQPLRQEVLGLRVEGRPSVLKQKKLETGY